MKNEEKAKEIYKDNLYECEVRGVAQDENEILFMLGKMAEWKDEQFFKFVNSLPQDKRTKSKEGIIMKIKSLKDKVLDATETLCVGFLVLFLWSCAIFFVAVGIYVLFNLL